MPRGLDRVYLAGIVSDRDFVHHFAQASDRRLVEAIDHPGQSDPAAVEAAREELVRRGLDEAATEALRREITADQERLDRRKAKAHKVVGTVSKVAQASREFMLDTGQMDDTRRRVIWMIIALGLPWLGWLGSLSDVAMYMQNPEFFDLGDLEDVLPLFWLPAAMILIWKRWRSGWFTGAMFAAYALGFSTATLLMIARYEWGSIDALTDALDELDTPREPFTSDPAEASLDTTSFIITTTPGSGLPEFLSDSYYSDLDYFVLISSFLYAAGLVVLFMFRGTTRIFVITDREKWLTVIAVFALMLVRSWRM